MGKEHGCLQHPSLNFLPLPAPACVPQGLLGQKDAFPTCPLMPGCRTQGAHTPGPYTCRARCSLHIPTPCPVLGERLPRHRASGRYQSQLCKRFGPFLLCFLRGNIHIFPSVFYFKAPSLPSSIFNSKCDAFVPFLSLALIL